MSIVPEYVFHELAATRYMSAAGLMVILYDHLLTFADEVELIWPAPATYAKYIFLLNRYTVLGTNLAVAYEMCGFVDTTFSHERWLLTVSPGRCKQFIFTCSMIAIVSVGIANLLILHRVVILWEHRPIVLKVMTVGFLISFATQVATMIVVLINNLPFIVWSDLAGMCIATKASKVLVAVWASPLLFETFVLGSTALNALDRPRAVELPIIKALHSDGLGWFLSITCLRIVNLILATMSRPSLTFLAVFFIWAMTTTILGRLLLQLRRAECADSEPAPFTPTARAHSHSGDWAWDTRRRSRAISPFGLVPLTKSVSGGSLGSSHSGGGRAPSPDGFLELAEVTPALQYQYHYRKRTYDPNVRPWD
ncbi:hypothetical protein C8Q80DRAFT_1114898 [Daedaleopsis nitida]|nr:hypothetical protein C8Q80DRAFT_1114898 [Daedaleopsis nitida]